MTEPDTALAVPVRPEALALQTQRQAGIHALGAQTDAEFSVGLATLKNGLRRLDEVIATVLVEGVDYGTIPGAGDKKNLLQPGAEKLALIAKLVPSFVIQRTVSDGKEAPAVHYAVRCQLHLGNNEGPVVAEGVGACSSHESKYRYRKADRSCPKCGKTGTILKSKFPAKGGPFKGLAAWYCFDKRGGCRAEFAPTDPAIVNQVVGNVENENPHDLDNTYLKMAKKRALIDAVKTATGGSARMTQDLEDIQAGARWAEAEVVDESPEAPQGEAASMGADRGTEAPPAEPESHAPDDSAEQPNFIQRNKARAAFMAELRRQATAGLRDKASLANSDAGREARAELLCALLGWQRDAWTSSNDLTVEQWDKARYALMAKAEQAREAMR